MIHSTRSGATLLLGVLLAAAQSCGASGPWGQTPQPTGGLPQRFTVDPAQAPAPRARGCAVHLVDDRDGTRLELIRSTAVPPTPAGDVAIGDYRIEPQGRYGLGPTELIRLECPSGHPLGAVH